MTVAKKVAKDLYSLSPLFLNALNVPKRLM